MAVWSLLKVWVTSSRGRRINKTSYCVLVALIACLVAYLNLPLSAAPSSFHIIAERQFIRGDFSAAKNALGKSTDLQSRILRGRIQEIEEPGVSLDLLKATSENPNSAIALAWAGHALGESAKTRAEGLQMLRSAASKSPNDPEVLSLLGRLLFRSGEQEQGLRLMQRAGDLSAHSFVVGINLANSYLDAFDSKKALAEFDRLVSNHRQMPLAYFYRACYFKQVGNNQQAMADCDKALAINPSFQPALASKAFWLLQDKKFKAATQPARLCIANEGSNTFTSKALRVLIDCEIALKSDKSAVEHLSQLINRKVSERICSSDEIKELLLLRASAYERLGNWQKAEADLSRIQKQYKPTSQILLLKARLLEDQNKLEEALAQYNLLIDRGLPAPAFYRGRAEVYRKLGRAALSEADKKKAQALEAPNF